MFHMSLSLHFAICFSFLCYDRGTCVTVIEYINVFSGRDVRWISDEGRLRIMGYKSFERHYVVSKPMCEDPLILPKEFLCFVLSIGLHLHVGVCDSGANVTCGRNDSDTRKCDVRWPVKEFETPHTLMMHLNACGVLMIRDITRKVKAQSPMYWMLWLFPCNMRYEKHVEGNCVHWYVGKRHH